jgi:hypothetical protein
LFGVLARNGDVTPRKDGLKEAGIAKDPNTVYGIGFSSKDEEYISSMSKMAVYTA